MYLEYYKYLPFVIVGIIVIFLLRLLFVEHTKKDEKKFNIFMWFKASFEERDGRASGKAITVFCFVVTWIATHFCILFRAVDLLDSQYKLLDSSMNGMMYLIISLYTIKKAGEIPFLNKSKAIIDPIKDELKTSDQSKSQTDIVG